jgi:DNA-binding protein Fis
MSEEMPQAITLQEMERIHILRVLELCKTKVAAAQVLGISIRTLRNKLKQYREG